MSGDTTGDQLALNQMERSVEEVELRARRGEYVWFFFKDVATVARLLGAQHLADRVLEILRGASDPYFLTRATAPLQEIEREYPPYRDASIVESLRQMATQECHLSLAFDRRYEEAFQAAQSDATRIEKIAETQAILGDIEVALQSVHMKVRPAVRQKFALIVIAIELFRRRENERFQGVCTQLESLGLELWDRVHLALGYAGRVPWSGYPYPDY